MFLTCHVYWLLVLLVSVGSTSGPHDDEDIGQWPDSGSGVEYTSAPVDRTSLLFTQSPPRYESSGPARKIYIGTGVAVLSIVIMIFSMVILIKLLKRRRSDKPPIQPPLVHREVKETSSNVYTYINPALLLSPKQDPVGGGGYLTPVHGGSDKRKHIYMNSYVKPKI